jgi:hypothetical protein
LLASCISTVKGDKTMQNVVPLIFAALFVYLLFFRKGGMGCCGGHGAHESEKHRGELSGESPHSPEGKVVDLGKDEYTVKGR